MKASIGGTCSNAVGQWRSRAHDDANLISKLQANIRQLIARIEELETELEMEQRGRMRVIEGIFRVRKHIPNNS